MMPNIHYNHNTTLEKREKITALWTFGSKQALVAKELDYRFKLTLSNIVNKFLQRGTFFPVKSGWKERTVSSPRPW